MSVDLNALRKTAEGLRTSREEESKRLRKRLREQKSEKYKKYLQDLREDSNTIRDALKEKILEFIATRLSQCFDPDEDQEYRLWNIHRRIDKPLSLKLRIKPSTYFTGYWDTATRCHRFSDWKNAGIGLMVEELNKVLSPITLVDISSKGLSCNWVYLCKVPSSSSMDWTPVCADEQNADEQNADEQNADERKADKQNADECKADEQNADECKADEQNADEQNADECKADEQNADKCKADKPKPFRRTYPVGAPMYGIPSFRVDEDTDENKEVIISLIEEPKRKKARVTGGSVIVRAMENKDTVLVEHSSSGNHKWHEAQILKNEGKSRYTVMYLKENREEPHVLVKRIALQGPGEWGDDRRDKYKRT